MEGCGVEVGESGSGSWRLGGRRRIWGGDYWRRIKCCRKGLIREWGEGEVALKEWCEGVLSRSRWSFSGCVCEGWQKDTEGSVGENVG